MTRTKQQSNKRFAEFESAFLYSIDQTSRGEGRISTPEQILARRAAGRPKGPVKTDVKISTTIRLSPDVVNAFRSAGSGWQTRIDTALKDWLQTHKPVKTQTKNAQKGRFFELIASTEHEVD